MFQGQGIWDYRNVIRGPSPAEKIFLLYLLLACVIATVKFLKVWRPWLVFRPSSRRDAVVDQVQYLQTAASSLGQWIGLTFLSWGLYSAVFAVNVCDRLLEQATLGWGPIVVILLDYARLLIWASSAAIFLYLVRWHMLKRIQQLR